MSDPRAPGVAEELHTFSQYASSAPVRGYDLFPDGRVVFVRIPDDLASGAVAGEVNHIELFLDWFQELERIVPSNR